MADKGSECEGICLMGQINITNLPEYAPEAWPASAKLRTHSSEAENLPAFLSAAAPQDDLQLTKLSAVLSGLGKSASAVRSQVGQVMASVRNGTYQVNPLQVSRSIVGDALASR